MIVFGLIIFGFCTGIIAEAVNAIVYNAWLNIIGSNVDRHIERIAPEIFVAMVHSFAVNALVPLVAGAALFLLMLRNARPHKMIGGTVIAGAAAGATFYITYTFVLQPVTVEMFNGMYANLSSVTVTRAILMTFVVPLLICVVEFIIWTTTGGVIAYYLTSRSFVEWSKDSWKSSGIVGLALVSLVAIAPPAITYVVTSL